MGIDDIVASFSEVSSTYSRNRLIRHNFLPIIRFFKPYLLSQDTAKHQATRLCYDSLRFGVD